MPGVQGQVQRRGVERRKAIVDAAVALFNEDGPRRMSIADIASAVGVTAGTVLHHFGSKEALLLEVVRERDRRGARLVRDMAAEGGIALLERMTAMAEQTERERSVTAAHMTLLADGIEPGPTRDYFVVRDRMFRDGLAAALEADRRKGRIRADLDCATKAAEILAFLDGAALHWLLDPSPPLVDVYRSYLSAVLRDLKPKRAR